MRFAPRPALSLKSDVWTVGSGARLREIQLRQLLLMALECGGAQHGRWLRLVAAQDLEIVPSKGAKTLDWPAAMQNKTPVLNEQGHQSGTWTKQY